MNRDGFALAWLLATLFAAGPVAGDGSVAVEDAYFEILASWARGSETAVSELSGLQQRIVSHAAGFEIDRDSFLRLPSKPVVADEGPTAMRKRLPGRLCLLQIQRHAEEQMRLRDPETLLALAYFEHLLYSEQMGAQWRPWLAGHSKERTFHLVESYRRSAEKTRPNAASMLIALADALGAASFFETLVESREVFSRVLDLDFGNPVALYWLAYLDERSGDHGKAVRHLERLTSAGVDDAEIALRLAVNRARVGRAGRADRRLEEIARGDGPDWTRVVAYQELGRWHAERDGDRAVAYLREAVERFPRHARLRLQLSYLVHAADWTESAALAGAVEASWAGDPGPTPRRRYCLPRRDEIDPELERLRGEVERRMDELARGLERLTSMPWSERFRTEDCPRELPR
ncbi:MAG: tetratricopeptide repeat protein [bacterium]|nr:tetratricopeptide repeat protein [bacterium]